MARLFAAGLQQRFKELDLAPAQFMVLLELWEEDGLTQAVLTDRLDVEQATMANTLSRMQRDGLIDRIANPKDKRTRVIKLTPKARGVRQKALAAAATQNAEALKGLNEQEAETLIALMQKVILTLKRR
ncbi:MarR family transcriptional regulator [Shimia thalassica]|uniref:MarR family winged helix-turn-helix transcriptional regulator n=1 Tax=Shimia thalassica TaxID=1715693 RepID=UPI002735FBC8|nr:MarR family transcriptional regulator [Shimia thalassica]MDP2492376.1 MarR family transcriptional regulator [Shimia thalassica]